jgi:hypothetical protein
MASLTLQVNTEGCKTANYFMLLPYCSLLYGHACVIGIMTRFLPIVTSVVKGQTGQAQ